MWIASLLVSCAAIVLVHGQALDIYPFGGGGYCSRLPAQLRCCVGRRDDCSTPISTTRCYCDSFCNQHGPNRDCCPDYESICGTGPIVLPGCPYGGINYNLDAGVRLTDTCYACTCRQISYGSYELQCEYVCSPKPQGVCPYSSIDYPAGGHVNIGDSCYSCICKRSAWYTQVSMTCSYVCRPPAPLPPPINRCYHENRFIDLHETVRANCRICTCQATSSSTYEMSCYADPACSETGCHYNSQVYRVGSRIRMGLQECACTSRPGGAEFICIDPRPIPDFVNPFERITLATYGWAAYKYSFLVGRSMEEVFRQRAGVCRPETQVIYDALFSEAAPASNLAVSYQRDTFDARTQWPGLVRPISDAGDYPISWAITIADLASDRKAIHSQGKENLPLSAQNLISCARQTQGHCSSTFKGWEYLHTYGIVSEECYPRNAYDSGTCQVYSDAQAMVSRCPSNKGHRVLVRLPRHHRISTDERNIRSEIATNGPVQAHIRVKEDFFYYRSGVYRHVYGNLHNTREYYLAVRIIGWGTDVSRGSPVNYWICANSWGTGWGENGYFRIQRGTNECQIEEYVYAVKSS